MSNTQNMKSKFRASSIWKKFRKAMMIRDKIDYITGKKLYTGFNVHHLDLRAENYKDLKPEKFICLNKQTHDCIHFLYTYWKKDKDILKRVEEILEEMELYSNQKSGTTTSVQT